MAEHDDFVQPGRSGAQVRVRVQPGASRPGIVGVSGGELRIRVAAPPVEGRANEEARALLAEALDLPRSSVQLVRGETSRMKCFAVHGLGPQAVRQRIDVHLAARH